MNISAIVSSHSKTNLKQKTPEALIGLVDIYGNMVADIYESNSPEILNFFLSLSLDFFSKNVNSSNITNIVSRFERDYYKSNPDFKKPAPFA